MSPLGNHKPLGVPGTLELYAQPGLPAPPLWAPSPAVPIPAGPGGEP